MKNPCQCGHEETIHVLGVCAVLSCACVRRDLQKTMHEDGAVPIPLFFSSSPGRQ